MRKVFTKYDEPYVCIHEPYLPDLMARPLTPDTPIEWLPMKERLLNPVNIENGLEGVYFVDYENAPPNRRVLSRLLNHISAMSYRNKYA